VGEGRAALGPLGGPGAGEPWAKTTKSVLQIFPYKIDPPHMLLVNANSLQRGTHQKQVVGYMKGGEPRRKSRRVPAGSSDSFRGSGLL
jgi:hypothetical protein